MKKLVIACMIVAVCAACGGSSSVDNSVKQVEKALEKVEKKKGKMTDEDWRALEKEVEEPMKVIVEAIEKDKVGVMKKIKLVAVVAKWGAVLAEVGISELEKRTGVERENFNKELEKAVKELENNSSADLEKLGKELEKVAKELEIKTTKK